LVYSASVLYNSNNPPTTSLPFNLVRMYVGMEDPDILIEDIRNSLNHVK